MDIPGCEILEKIGEGACGEVWKARQLSLDRVVAIKVLKPVLADDPDQVQRFLSGARAAAKLKHPNLVQIFDVAKDEGGCHFIMEYVHGRTLREVIRSKGKLPEKTALSIALGIAEALRDAWKGAHLSHGNLNTANVMIDEDGGVKVMDMGLASKADPVPLISSDKDSSFEGSPHYKPPEQVKGFIELDARSDMYSLGAMLYHMVTGVAPFEGETTMAVLMKHINGELPHPRDVRPGLSHGIAMLMSLLMMKQREQRPDHWSEVIRDIKKVKVSRILVHPQVPHGASTIAPSAVASRRKRRSSKCPAWAHVLAWLVVLACWAAFTYYWLNR